LARPRTSGICPARSSNFFDQVYYPTLLAKPGAPYGLYVHGASDTTGAVLAVRSIAGGLGWQEVSRPVEHTGQVARDAEDKCYELGATVAANLLG